MGSSKGALRVVIDSNKLVAGQSLTGKVYLCVQRALDDCELIVELKCDESVNWTFGVIPQSRNENILSHVVMRAPLSGTLQAGEYVFSFEYHLPADIPPSLAISGFDGSGKSIKNVDAKISYQLLAQVVTPSIFTTIKHQHDVEVHASLISSVGSMEQTPAKKTSTVWSHQGACDIYASMTETVYMPGEILEADVHIHNRSLVPGKAFVRLVQVMSVRTHRTKTAYRWIGNNELGHIAPGGMLEQCTPLCIANKRTSGDILPVTTVGNRIKCEFFLEVLCKFPVDQPCRLMVPVTITSHLVSSIPPHNGSAESMPGIPIAAS